MYMLAKKRPKWGHFNKFLILDSKLYFKMFSLLNFSNLLIVISKFLCGRCIKGVKIDIKFLDEYSFIYILPKCNCLTEVTLISQSDENNYEILGKLNFKITVYEVI